MKELPQTAGALQIEIDTVDKRLERYIKQGLKPDITCFVYCPFCHSLITNQNIQTGTPFLLAISSMTITSKQTGEQIVKAIKDL
jgi:hypothetical protein